MKKLLFLLTLLSGPFVFGQITITAAQVSTITDAPQGDLYLTSDTDKLYIGIENGTLRLIGNENYEKVVIWAEENNSIASNENEWSFGNGSTGTVGIPLPEDWELYAVSFQAESHNGGTSTTRMAVQDLASNSELYNFTMNITVDNFSYTETLTTPVNIPAGTVIGFRTLQNTGASITDARISAWLRRKP